MKRVLMMAALALLGTVVIHKAARAAAGFSMDEMSSGHELLMAGVISVVVVFLLRGHFE